jgi:hypothetical protein
MGQLPFETEVEPILASLMLRCWVDSLVQSLTHAFAPDESMHSATGTWLLSETDEAPSLGTCQLGLHTLERQCAAERMACVHVFAVSADRRMATRCERNCYLNTKVSMTSSTLRDDEPEEARSH